MTAKMLLSKLPVEIFLSRRCVLKKIRKKRSLKIIFFAFYIFPEAKNLNGVSVQSAMEIL